MGPSFGRSPCSWTRRLDIDAAALPSPKWDLLPAERRNLPEAVALEIER
jgi:hypothetical protein